MERGKGPVVNQIYDTLIRALEQERRMRELEELAGRIAALEEVLRGRRTGLARRTYTGSTAAVLSDQFVLRLPQPELVTDHNKCGLDLHARGA